MVSAAVNEICLWAKKHVVGLSFSLLTIGFELGQSKKSVSGDNLGDWKFKFAREKDKFMVRRHLLVWDSFLNWFLQATTLIKMRVEQEIANRKVHFGCC